MARPNLSESSMQHSALSIQSNIGYGRYPQEPLVAECRVLTAESFGSRNRQAQPCGDRFLSNGFLRSREARAFPPAPSESIFLCDSAPHRKPLLAAAPWLSGRPMRSETQLIITASLRSWDQSSLDQLRVGGQSLLYGGVGQGSHDLVAGRVRVQSVFGQILFQQTFGVHHGAEVVEINATRSRAIVLQPAIQLQDFLRRPLGEQILRPRGVVMYRKNRRKNHADMMSAGQLGQGRIVGLDLLQRDGPGVPGD